MYICCVVRQEEFAEKSALEDAPSLEAQAAAKVCCFMIHLASTYIHGLFSLKHQACQGIEATRQLLGTVGRCCLKNRDLLSRYVKSIFSWPMFFDHFYVLLSTHSKSEGGC